MEQVHDDDEQLQISFKRPFQAKFIKELNVTQNQKNKKRLKKIKQQKNINPKKMEKFQKVGISPSFKSIKRLPQTNRNGNKIFGHWKNNQIQGEAQIYYSNGVIFRGLYQNGIKVKGHFTFLHGYEYIGNCLENKFNGEGSLIFPSGKIITGEWKQYNLVGKGKIQYPNGEVYYGQIKNLKKHGKGYLFFKDSSKYEGEFEDGQITGYGTYFIDNKAVCCGNWVDGELQEQINLSQIKSVDESDNSQIDALSRKSTLKLAEKSYEGKVQKRLRFAEMSKQKDQAVRLQEDTPSF